MGKQESIWKLASLPPLVTGDCLAFRAERWRRWVVKIIGAETWHWAMVGEAVIDDRISTGDYSIYDSTSKGITAHLLSEYQHLHMRVYRPKLPPGEQDKLRPFILKRYLYYGDQKYDYWGVFIVGVWWLLNKISKVEWFVHNSRKFWCLEFNEIVWRDLGLPLVSGGEPPYPTNMEKSSSLELIWQIF